MKRSYPVNLNLVGKKVLVVGEGAMADEKIAEINRADGEVVQIPSDQYDVSVLEEIWLIVAATADPELNARILKDGTARKIWVNSADDPPNCNVTLPARLRRGDLLVTASTAGVSPAFSTWVRNQLENLIPAEYETLLETIFEVRSEIRKSKTSTELFNWQSSLDLAIERGILQLISKDKISEARELLRQCLFSS